MAIRAEDFLKKHLDVEEDITNMTVPLTLESISHVSGPAVLANEDALIGERTEIPAHTRRRFEKRGASDAVDALREFGLKPDDPEEFFQLDGDTLYGIEYAEDLSIPRGHVGIVFPDSQLVEAGGTLFTSVYTPDAEPPLEGTLRVDNDMLLKKDLRIGTLLIFETEDVTTARIAKLLKQSLSQKAAEPSAKTDDEPSGETTADTDEGTEDGEGPSVAGELPDSESEGELPKAENSEEGGDGEADSDSAAE